MKRKQSFGGDWTIEKLGILSHYLDFYLTALKNQSFDKIYIDAFAGSGHIELQGEGLMIEGSARIALNSEKKFDKYIFIERKQDYINQLKEMIIKEYRYYYDRIKLYKEDCNNRLKEICQNID